MSIFLLALATLGSALLSPFMAAFVVVREPHPRGSRGAAWLGISIGLGMASTTPLFCLYLALYGQAWGYRLAPLFGLIALLLGLRSVRVFRQRLRGVDRRSFAIAMACLGFALLVAAALAPVTRGAPPPAACGELGAESCGPGNVLDYLRLVVPLLLAMGLEAWLLLRGPRRDTATSLERAKAT